MRRRRIKGTHQCSWPKCKVMVSTRTPMCRKHYMTLPLDLRALLLKTPKEGQSRIQERVQQWIANQNPANYPPGIFL